MAKVLGEKESNQMSAAGYSMHHTQTMAMLNTALRLQWLDDPPADLGSARPGCSLKLREDSMLLENFVWALALT